MSFVELNERVSVSASRSNVTVSFIVRKSSGSRPHCQIGLRAPFLVKSGFGEAVAYRIAVGQGEDAGKIRLWPDATGVFTARKAHAARILDIGHIPPFGQRLHRARYAAVELIDGAAVITLPPAGADDDADAKAAPFVGSDVETDTAGSVLTELRDSGVIKARAAAGPARAKVPADREIWEHSDLTITLTAGEEAVSRRGATVEVSPRGAKLVQMLAKAMPNCIGDKHLIEKLFDKPSSVSAASLEMVIADLKGLKKLGLEIRTQRGVGRQLVVLP
ncbi:hypothetical protein [Bradyrhizobium sp. SZCCHNR1020]|uniref:hypothetical protein n=1 Tax=Bradyrhizobium sp. SZCCHNR1020 TaxID=3057343 RepID=UPI0029166F5A|nr:hypothetical protein [Bradyrhizobium sp. SZCCHNR1020]